MRFDSRVVCEFECNTSKDNGSFVTLSLSSTVAITLICVGHDCVLAADTLPRVLI